MAGRATKRAGGGESDKERGREGETARLNGGLSKETSCPRGFILLKITDSPSSAQSVALQCFCFIDDDVSCLASLLLCVCVCVCV